MPASEIILDSVRKFVTIRDVEFRENELRELLFSPHGRKCAEALLSMPDGATSVTVKLIDGTIREVKDQGSALLLLEEVFHWKPDKIA